MSARPQGPLGSEISPFSPDLNSRTQYKYNGEILRNLRYGQTTGSEISPHLHLIWTAGVRESDLDINTMEKYQETWDMSTSGQTLGSAGVRESELNINTTEKYQAEIDTVPL